MAEAAAALREEVLLRDDCDGVTTLTLNRPKQRNSLSEALMAALTAEMTAIAEDPAVRVIVLAANGPVFCAGHDLKELTAARQREDRGRAYYQDIMKRCSTMMLSILQNPKPVIAKVHGTATAAGCQLVATCDLAIAADDAHFATPGVNIGLFCSTPMVALSRNVSRKHAMEMLLSGDMVDAAHAAEIGLINRAMPADALDTEVSDLATKIASKSSMTVSIGKRAFYDQLELGVSDAYAYTSDVMVKNMLTHDAEEGVNAFIEKRAPTWKDR
ncbi:MAG TPA: enoyl-CoA hydratase [Rhodobiaceae bacterium]|nr:enoyl-CoA hydratase [Rhodobiaceae bacterium]|tara:strand:+ start:1732 stop:2547 length:816 start_codon:yes stop_codon:yes gene_type:complete